MLPGTLRPANHTPRPVLVLALERWSLLDVTIIDDGQLVVRKAPVRVP